MKLIFCPACHDVVKCTFVFRTCQCGKSWGKYIDMYEVEVGGRTIVLGLDNNDLLQGLRSIPKEGKGPSVRAWVFAQKSDKIRKITSSD